MAPIDPQCVRWLGALGRCNSLATQMVDGAPLCDAHADEIRGRRTRAEAVLIEYRAKERRDMAQAYTGNTQASRVAMVLADIRQWLADHPSDDGTVVIGRPQLEKLLDLVGIQQEQIEGLERVAMAMRGSQGLIG